MPEVQKIDLEILPRRILDVKGRALLKPAVQYDDLTEAALQRLPTFQRPWERRECIMEAIQYWHSIAAPAGIAQASITHKKPTGILACIDIHYRHATPEEIRLDLNELGEQVIGEKIEETPETPANRPYVTIVDGSKYVYIGGPRVKEVIFPSVVFQGPVPQNISKLVEEIKSISESGGDDEMIINQGYQFFHATDGRISYLPLTAKDYEAFDPDNLKFHGMVEIEDAPERKMTYFSEEDRSGAEDFTSRLLV